MFKEKKNTLSNSEQKTFFMQIGQQLWVFFLMIVNNSIIYIFWYFFESI